MLYIDGRVRRDTGGVTYDKLSPWSGEVVGQAADAAAEDVDQAIAAARRAFDTMDWPTNHALRVRKLADFHDALVARRDELVRIAQIEAGATLGTAYSAQVDGALQGFGDLLDAFEQLEWHDDREIGRA